MAKNKKKKNKKNPSKTPEQTSQKDGTQDSEPIVEKSVDAVSGSQGKVTASTKESSELDKAKQLVANGDYNEAKKVLLDVVQKDGSSEAKGILKNIEMDVRTLMVGALGLATLILIPTAGFKYALFTLPVFFLLLLLDPGFFRSPE